MLEYVSRPQSVEGSLNGSGRQEAKCMLSEAVRCEAVTVFCGFEPGHEPAKLLFEQKRQYCRSHTHFARWLHAEARGQIAPRAVLVVTWREAIACLAAITAARTGNAKGLRIDSKRPLLSEIVGHVPEGRLPNVAVGSVIVVAESESVYIRAARYITEKQVSFDGIGLHVCLAPSTAARPQTAPWEGQHMGEHMAMFQSLTPGSSTSASSSSFQEPEQQAPWSSSMFKSSSSCLPLSIAMLGLGFGQVYRIAL